MVYPSLQVDCFAPVKVASTVHSTKQLPTIPLVLVHSGPLYGASCQRTNLDNNHRTPPVTLVSPPQGSKEEWEEEFKLLSLTQTTPTEQGKKEEVGGMHKGEEKLTNQASSSRSALAHPPEASGQNTERERE